jgi:hypothetical protein
MQKDAMWTVDTNGALSAEKRTEYHSLVVYVSKKNTTGLGIMVG